MLDEKRMNRVLEKLDTDQMLITDPFAIYYLTGRWIFAGERFLGLLIKRLYQQNGEFKKQNK